MVSSRKKLIELPPLVWLIVTAEALSFLLFATLHTGVRVPLGFATLAEPVIVPATIIEGFAGLSLGASAYAAFRRRPWAMAASIVATMVSIGGVLLGMAAVSRAGGRGFSDQETATRRFELGLGAGRPGAEADNRALGIPFDSGGIRVDRLAESLSIVKRLLAGERVESLGKHYAVSDAVISPRPIQQPLPILVAGSGPRLLALAGREADIVALGIPPGATESSVADRVGRVRQAAGERFSEIEINLNLMAVAGQLPRYLAAGLGSAGAQFAESSAVSVLRGSTEQMCQRLITLRESLGISYFMDGDELMEALAPVVALLAGR